MFEVFGPSLHFCNQLNSKLRWVVQFLLVIFLGRYRKFPVERVVRWAGDLARAHGVNVLLEPLNQRDVPGYLHSQTSQTRDLIETIDRDNVYLQFDFYHLQIMEGNLSEALRCHFDVLGHVQFSSVPGRYEPQYGELNMTYFFDLLDTLGYVGGRTFRFQLRKFDR